MIDEARDDRPPTAVDRDGHGARRFARALRLELAREHLDRADDDDADLVDPISMFARFAQSAARLQQWHDGGRVGPRPSGRLRPYSAPRLGSRTLAWSTPLYRTVYDPDGRPLALRYRHRF